MTESDLVRWEANFTRLRGACHPLAFRNARSKHRHEFRVRRVPADTLDLIAETRSVETTEVYWRSQCLHLYAANTLTSLSAT